MRAERRWVMTGGWVVVVVSCSGYGAQQERCYDAAFGLHGMPGAVNCSRRSAWPPTRLPNFRLCCPCPARQAPPHPTPRCSVHLATSVQPLLTHPRAGTPTPNTPDASVERLQPLLAFLHHQAYGNVPDSSCWKKAVQVGWGGTCGSGWAITSCNTCLRTCRADVGGRCCTAARPPPARRPPASVPSLAHPLLFYFFGTRRDNLSNPCMPLYAPPIVPRSSHSPTGGRWGACACWRCCSAASSARQKQSSSLMAPKASRPCTTRSVCNTCQVATALAAP